MDYYKYCMETLPRRYEMGCDLYKTYEDDDIAYFSLGSEIYGNPKLSLCDGLDYKNDEKVLNCALGDGKPNYKLVGEHLDRIRGKMIQLPFIFRWNTETDVIQVRAFLEKENLLIMTSRRPYVFWFKHAKFVKIEDMKTTDGHPKGRLSDEEYLKSYEHPLADDILNSKDIDKKLLNQCIKYYKMNRFKRLFNSRYQAEVKRGSKGNIVNRVLRQLGCMTKNYGPYTEDEDAN